jgi:hypothetical protein
MKISLRVVLPVLLAVASCIGILCTRNPIGDRILAKACILGASKYGECQLAK